MKKIFFIILIVSAFYSCKTDFEINAPYDTSPIIYGLLDQSVDTQFIKINRSFLGTNNMDYTRINDSTHFKNVTARVEEIKNGIVQQTYPLQFKSFPVLPDDGIFYTDSQRVYYFVEPFLKEASTYRLVGNGDGKEFSAETKLIQDFNFVLRFRNFANKPSGAGFALDGQYVEIKPEWKTAKDGRRYDVSVRFNYAEHKSSGVTNKFIDYKVGTKKSSSLHGGETMLMKFNSEGFFTFIGNQAKLIDTVGVTKRVVLKAEFVVTAASDVFNTFMEVNEPISSIASERPEFTNIDGGYGIFSSRYVVKLDNVRLSEKTVKELNGGKYTNDLKFCSDNPAYSGEIYYCP